MTTETSGKLTRAELESLPRGARVRIVWNGGNGPHVYEVRVDAFGVRRFFYRDVYVGSIDDVRDAWLVSK